MKRISYSIRFFGSKSYQLQEIMDEINNLNKDKEYNTFVEVFGGSGRLTFALDGFDTKVYNDRDPALVNLMTVLDDDDYRQELLEYFKMMPWSRVTFEHFKEINDIYVDMYEKGELIPNRVVPFALATYYIHGYSFQGKASRMGYFITSWRNIGKENIDVLEHFNENNIYNVIYTLGSYEDVIKKFDSPTTIFYFDPPYIRESSIYRYGFTEDDYYKLKELLDNIKGKYIMNISMHDTIDVKHIFGKPTYEVEYNAHAYITNKSRPKYKMGYWRNW